MKIIIIEDEQYIAQDLANCIREIREHFQIIKILSSVREAKAYFKTHSDHDLIFSDIQLGDGSSFDIYDKAPPAVPVIFCTAYNNYAIEAFKANGIDYLLKPVNKDSVRLAIEKYERLLKPAGNANLEQMIRFMKDSIPEKQSATLLVHHKDKIIPVRIGDIAVFYIQNEICRIMDFEGRHFSISETLDGAEKIAGRNFFRANRQVLINREAIKEVSQGFSRTHTVVLTVDFKEPIVVSKEKTPLLLRWLSAV